MKRILFIGLLAVLASGCKQEPREKKPRFTLLDSTQTGIQFVNALNSTDKFNIYTYRNFYNGGGVGIGDVNADGLMDIYLTANMQANRLFLNKGGLKFEDVTEQAGVAGAKLWSTGVSMVDINADGRTDIYVCNSGDVDSENRENEFFINNGDGTFTDRAEEMGLADKGLSTHAAFFDYDKDGDLDVYILNNSFKDVGSANLVFNQRNVRDPEGGDKLYRNDNGIFKDVSEEAGIYGSSIGFGLGVSVTDLNKDGWMDLYISNDFFERDYLYINNGDGTFTEDITGQIQSLSVSSMGSDAADLNGDGFPEVFVTEMLPATEERLKALVHFENYNYQKYVADNDYYYQYMRNVLHVNQGLDENGRPIFAELGRLSGVEATDWSWGALIFDMDNDGNKDIFVSNGIYQDIINQDYLKYISSEAFIKMVVEDGKVNYNKLVEVIPSTKAPNYAFAGSGDLRFTNKAEEWGLGAPGYSNGSAYGDMDNDGDLDLVVNNVNMAPFVYRNNTDTLANYIRFELSGKGDNKMAIGANITLHCQDKALYLEQSLTRGFQSSVDPRLTFGLGVVERIDSAVVSWPLGAKTVLKDLDVNRTIRLDEPEGATAGSNPLADARNKARWFQEVQLPLEYKHKENPYVDFDQEFMLYHMNSKDGPYISTGDVNGDGLADLFLSGARYQPGQLFIQQQNQFQASNQELFETDRFCEDGESILIDVDGDAHLDLIVASQGNDDNSERYLKDRLYLNDGKGNFSKSDGAFPGDMAFHTSTIKAADYDRDGDPDLFVGARLKTGHYGQPTSSYLLKNDGRGAFQKARVEDLEDIGMVTDALWADIDNDGWVDLVVVGEWMSPMVFRNDNGNLKNASNALGLESYSGWWNSVAAGDVNKDGYPDLILGNHGLNSRFRCSPEKPLKCYVSDFDGNGDIEQIITQYNGDRSYPMPLLHDLWQQMPSTKKKFVKYEDYKGKTIEEVFSKEQLRKADVLTANTLSSAILLSNGKGGFTFQKLPVEAQYSPIYAIHLDDFNDDGNPDLLLAGNLYDVKPEVGRYDANYGCLLAGDGKGAFTTVPFQESGLFIKGQVRDIKTLEYGGKKILLVARNDDILVAIW